MRAFIRWIFFEGDSIRKAIKNDENNENWPNARKFATILKDWQFEVNNQQKEINQIEIKNLKTRQLMADVQTWFISEYNLLNKPAKRTFLEKQKELKRLEQELKIYQYNLDHPKQELEEYEKRCLLKKIEIGERKIGNCKDELEEATKAYENEKKELCQRIAYDREDLEPLLREPEHWQIGQIQQLLSTVIKKKGVQPKTAFGWYSAWWKKYRDIDPPAQVDQPLNKLRSLIAKWQEHNGGKEPDPNPYEIWVEEKTEDSLIFLWKPMERELESVDEKGKKVKIKGQYLALCKNYLFNYYGEWYEVSDYYQTNYTTVAITATRSIFYNDYWSLLRSQANLILHHSTLGIGEICSCPSYEVYTSKNKFSLEYELKFDLYKLSHEQKRDRWWVKDESITVISGECPVIVNDIEKEFKKLHAFWDWETLAEAARGQRSILYFLLSKRLYEKTEDRKKYGGIWNYSFFLCPNKDESKTPEKQIPHIQFKRVGQFDKKAKISRLGKETLDDFLTEKGLWDEEMYHFRRTHIKAVLYWREMKIWEGNYWDLQNENRIVESVSPSGNCVTIMGSGRILAKITELVTVGIGENTKGILSIIITTATTVASAYYGNVAAGAAWGVTKEALNVNKSIAKTSARAGVGALGGGISQLAHNELMNTPNYSETTHTMTFHEFRHKYLFSKDRPISLWVEYNQELANQYRNKRELKGPMFYNYTNLDFLGRVLSQKDFFKASVVSWNMNKNSEWFREKIESGIYLYDDDYQDFYKKKLSDATIATSQGGITLGDWNEFVTVGGTGETILITADVSDADYNNIDYIGSPDPSIWQELNRVNNKVHEGDDPIPNNCLGCLLGGGSNHSNWKGNQDFTYNFTSGGVIHLKTRWSGVQTGTIPSSGGKVILRVRGSSAWLVLIGEKPETVRNPSGIPDGIPPSKKLPVDPTYANTPSSTSFNPNQFPQSSNLTPNPSGSGEFEINIPDIDVSPDPDFDPSLDPDIGQDPETDPTKDPDPTKDEETPPDHTTDTDDDND